MKYLGDEYLYPVVEKKEFLNNFGKTYKTRAKSPKIIIKGLRYLDACIDFKGEIVPSISTLVIVNKVLNALKFLLGLINSKLIYIYFNIFLTYKL